MLTLIKQNIPHIHFYATTIQAVCLCEWGPERFAHAAERTQILTGSRRRSEGSGCFRGLESVWCSKASWWLTHGQALSPLMVHLASSRLILSFCYDNALRMLALNPSRPLYIPSFTRYYSTHQPDWQLSEKYLQLIPHRVVLTWANKSCSDKTETFTFLP